MYLVCKWVFVRHIKYHIYTILVLQRQTQILLITYFLANLLKLASLYPLFLSSTTVVYCHQFNLWLGVAATSTFSGTLAIRQWTSPVVTGEEKNWRQSSFLPEAVALCALWMGRQLHTAAWRVSLPSAWQAIPTSPRGTFIVGTPLAEYREARFCLSQPVELTIHYSYLFNVYSNLLCHYLHKISHLIQFLYLLKTINHPGPSTKV